MLHYWVYIGTDSKFITAFTSNGVSGLDSVHWTPVASEIEGGRELFEIQSHRAATIHVPGLPIAIHRLMTLSPKDSDLYIHITFQDDTEQTIVQMKNIGNIPVPEIYELPKTRELATMKLNKCQFRSMKPIGDENTDAFALSVKVTGGIEMEVDNE